MTIIASSSALSGINPTSTLITVLLAAVCYHAIWIIYNLWFSPLRKFPGPFLSRISYLPRMWKIASGQEVAWVTGLHRKYGGVVRLCPNEISYTSYEAWKDIYGAGSKLVHRKWTGMYDPAFGHSASLQFIRDESQYTQMRRIFAPVFSDLALRQQQPMLKGLAQEIVNKLMQQINTARKMLGEEGDKEPSTIVDTVNIYNFGTFDVVGEMVFGGSFGMVQNFVFVPWIKKTFEGIKIGSLFVARTYFPILRPMTQVLLWLFKDQVYESLTLSGELVEKRLAIKEEDKERPDLWTEVINSQNSTDTKHIKLTRHEIHANALLFLAAGTETSATCLAGLTFLLLSHPDKLKKLTSEIRTTFKSAEDITLKALAQLSYLNNCIEEGLRMYPPIPVGFPRDTPAPGAIIAGEWIPSQTIVYVSHNAAYRLESNFRNPDQFIPERWTSSEYSCDKKSVMQAFSFGPRMCLGKALAYHEIRIFLSYLILHFDMELVNPKENWFDHNAYIAWEKRPLMVKFVSAKPN